MRIYPPEEDVEHAGDILDRGRRVQFARRPDVHDMEYRERLAESGQSVLDCWRKQTYIWGDILCDMLSRAPELQIGLVNDIMRGLI